MRLPERYKQTVYMASETFFGSDEFADPVAMRGIVSPKVNTIIVGGGTKLEQNTAIIQFEADAANVDAITANSHFWINREPDPEEMGSDFTHVVVSRDSTASGWFVSIEVRSVAGNTPII